MLLSVPIAISWSENYMKSSLLIIKTIFTSNLGAAKQLLIVKEEQEIHIVSLTEFVRQSRNKDLDNYRDQLQIIEGKKKIVT
jgi:hypothetical protein